MNEYTPKVYAIIADDDKLDEAIDGMVTLHRKEFRDAMRTFLMHEYVGAPVIKELMDDELQVIIFNKEIAARKAINQCDFEKQGNKNQCLNCSKSKSGAYMSMSCTEWKCDVEYDDICDKHDLVD